MKAKSLALGFLIGGTAAGISTLLSAPASGKETRQNLMESKESFKNYLSDLKKQIVKLKNTTVTASKEGKAAIKSFSSDIKLSINNWKKEILPHQTELKKELDAIETAIHDLETTLNTEKQHAYK